MQAQKIATNSNAYQKACQSERDRNTHHEETFCFVI